MKTYPSIPKDIKREEDIFAFSKYDGSSIRAEWNPKRGFYKFGRRNGLLDDSNPILKRSPELFLAKYGDALDKIFKAQRWESVVCFFEFFGPNSFAGNHDEKDTQDVVLFDISVHKKGFLDPRAFLKLVGHLPVQELLYEGPVTEEFLTSVRNGTLPNMPFEGVVCKGPFDRKAGLPLMFKVKSEAWLNKLREKCHGDEHLFNMLS